MQQPPSHNIYIRTFKILADFVCANYFEQATNNHLEL